MKILVLGPGGREHAIIRTLLRDAQVTQVDAAPGNAGIAAEVPVHPVDASSGTQVVSLAQRLGSDLVVIGPEAPLEAGVADALSDAGIPVFGPSQAAARLESSKAFAKEVMHAAAVPTARARTAVTVAEAQVAFDEFGAPYVVKDDGLAAGKGVVVTTDRAAATEHARACIEAGGAVLIEEFLDGPEVSVFVIADGTETGAIALSPAQDFKRIFDGDTGPNTGGMGAYTPLDWLPTGFTDEVLQRVARPVLAEMRKRGTPFTGVLYCGLAVTARGIQVIEFNTRFGDPETQTVLARLRSPLGQIMLAAANHELTNCALRHLEFSDDYAVGVVYASPGYPDTSQKGSIITGIEAAEAAENTAVFHAGTAVSDSGEYVANGGRLLMVQGTGESLEAARETAYAGVEKLRLTGGQYRTDIAAKAVHGQIKIPEA